MSIDDSIAAWADAARLPEPAAEDVYRRIVATPPAALGVTWWRDFTVDFTSRLVHSTRPVRLAA